MILWEDNLIAKVESFTIESKICQNLAMAQKYRVATKKTIGKGNHRPKPVIP